MIVGVPREVKNREKRVGLIPSGVRALVQAGHQVRVEKDAGLGAGMTNAMYEEAGATLVSSAADAWDAQMVIKVKEPLASEFELMKPGQILYTYLHLAAETELTQALCERKVTGIAYETIQESDNSLPLLRPMSEVAGRMSVQVGAYYLQSSWDEEASGRGILLGGVPGVTPGRVVVLGGGVAGANAAKVALGMGAQVTLFDVNMARLEYLDHVLPGRLVTRMSNFDNIRDEVRVADLVIGTVLLPGAKAPKLITREMVSSMATGSVIVDVSVDQGGCTETGKPTSHEAPTFTVDGVVHYCVTNMPGAVAKTSTIALTNVTLRYALTIANEGAENAARKFPAIAKGFNTYQGEVVHAQVAAAHDMKCAALEF